MYAMWCSAMDALLAFEVDHMHCFIKLEGALFASCYAFPPGRAWCNKWWAAATGPRRGWVAVVECSMWLANICLSRACWTWGDRRLSTAGGLFGRYLCSSFIRRRSCWAEARKIAVFCYSFCDQIGIVFWDICIGTGNSFLFRSQNDDQQIW